MTQFISIRSSGNSVKDINDFAAIMSNEESYETEVNNYWPNLSYVPFNGTAMEISQVEGDEQTHQSKSQKV